MSSLPRSSQAEVEAAAAELYARRQARSNLLDFTKFTFAQYRADPAHKLIADTLTRVVEGEIDRLIISAPPQSGKSELISVRFPAFWLGKRPDDPVVLTSYGASLAVDKSKQAREIVNSEEYRRLFPEILLRDDSRAGDHWRLASPYRGQLVAAGVRGPITGKPAVLGIIDDPFEDWAQAQSVVFRNHVWDWYRGTFRPRVWMGGVIILVMTRWHEDDLAGRLMADQPGRWHILRLPALAETQEERDLNNEFLGLPKGETDPLGRKPGEALTPTRFPRSYVLEIKTEVGPVVFSAEYQGVPRPPEGDRVKRSDFVIVGASPKDAKRVRYWDKAGSDNSGDYTVGLLMAEKIGTYYIEDVVRAQVSAYERKKLMYQTAILDAMAYGEIEWIVLEGEHEVHIDPVEFLQDANPLDPDYKQPFVVHNPGPALYIEQEGGSGGKDSVRDDIRILAQFGARRDLPKGDKTVRAEPWVAQVEAGNVKLVRGSWNTAYLNEVTAYPNASHDDQWDATSGAFKRLGGKRTTRMVVKSAS